MKLSNYELMRLERIKKNAERLKELGLDEFRFKLKPKKKKRIFKVKRIKPGEERRSKRLSSKCNDDDLMMLDYRVRARDGEERVSKQNGGVTPLSRIGTIISKKFPETGEFYEGEVTGYDAENKWYKIRYLDGDEEEFDEEELKQYRKKVQRYAHEKFKRKTLRKTLKIKEEEWKLSEEDRESLARGADENFLTKFQDFLEYEDRISHQNMRNVMRQVRKLATGEGIRYESPTYGWPEDCYFKKGEKITPMSDILELMIEGQACEDKWGRDHGNGWLISHPLKKLLLFQQFILHNPDFLTSKLRLRDYCE
mmetsp:Transcript_12970/g.32751  ORF Transcript_12970/g.32751 Transcript_12970/m.32751 type:complete len:310 (+) Transcript_12970:132-1061(+)